MLYLFLHQNQIKLLYVKKTLLGQYESAFYEKKHSGVDFIDEKGAIKNIDLIASAIKEALSSITPSGIKDKDVYLILPQISFQFLRVDIPADIAPSAMNSFVLDKARANIAKDLENYLFDYLIQDNEKQKKIIFFALEKDLFHSYQEALSLVDLKVVNIIPESLAYFKLFEKTLRKEKKENILYITYEKDQLLGYLYDSYGPVDEVLWQTEIDEKSSIEEIIREKTTEYEKQGKKINRLILSGENSDSIRQDTFTKNVGVWTNPLKRIIPHFYQDYLKIFIIPSDKTLPLLQYDVCIGTFIFSLENKIFTLLKKRYSNLSASSLQNSKLSIPKKEIFIFIISFILSFLAFYAVSRMNDNNPFKQISFLSKPTPTPTVLPPTPTPTLPQVNKQELKVKVLNGSGARGKASQVKDLLTEKGYGEILTDNADNFDFETTEIEIKKSKANLAPIIKEDLKDSVTSPKITTSLDEESAADIIIIFGTDFK
ncbi:MAG: LytR C-terminal domain-containing protein [Candidatus Roizmanbacteria bacterium]|nr:MAG: LytR C-terminal domain-containing protein [Candidatus Roizmanbacteria bacterium]